MLQIHYIQNSNKNNLIHVTTSLILYLKVVIPIKLIPFVIIIIIYLVIVSLIKYIFYKFMIKSCKARAFN